MADELSIKIVGDVAGGGGSGGGSGGDGKNVKKGMDSFSKGAGAVALGAVLGSMIAGPVGTKVGESVGKMFSSEKIAATIGAVVVAGIAHVLLGPMLGTVLSPIIAAAVFFGLKKGLEESEAIQGIKKSIGGGLGAVVDSIIGMGYLTLRWFQENIGSKLGEVVDIILDPSGWIEEKLGLSDFFNTTHTGQWFLSNVWNPIQGTISENVINVADLFGFGEEAGSFISWIDAKILAPIEKTMYHGVSISDLLKPLSPKDDINWFELGMKSPFTEMMRNDQIGISNIFDFDYENFQFDPARIKLPNIEIEIRPVIKTAAQDTADDIRDWWKDVEEDLGDWLVGDIDINIGG